MMAKQIDPRLQQAMQAIASGSASDAALLCTAVLKERKRDDMAMALLAQASNALGNYDDAMRWIQAAIAKNNKRADYHGLHADLLTTHGEFRKAIAAYDKALKLNPSHHGVIAGKANTWLRLNEPTKAKTLLKPFIEQGGEDLTLSIVYAKSLIEDGDPFGAAELLLGRLPAEKEPIETRRTMYFTLGTAMEKAGEFQSAFEAYTQGNALSVGGFDVSQCQAAHDDLIDAFPIQQSPRPSVPEHDGEQHVFIVGMLRSGSTLTEQIIDAHPHGNGLGELDTLPRLLNEWRGDRLFSDAWKTSNDDELNAIATNYCTRHTAHSTGDVVVDKQLGNFMFIGAIKQLFPKAKIIHCTRNPMSMGLSCFAQKLPPNTNPWASSLESICQFYAQYKRLMDHWHSIHDDILEVPYESLVQEQEEWTHKILAHCGLTFDERCMRFWETGRTVLTLSQDQVRRPMYATALKRHEHFGELLLPLQHL